MEIPKTWIMGLDVKSCFILFSCVFLVINTVMEEEWDNNDEVLEFSEARIDTKLQVKPFVFERDLEDVIRCLGKCLECSPACTGINYLRSTPGETSVCEILEHSFDVRETRTKLICAQHWIYYGISQISVSTSRVHSF